MVRVTLHVLSLLVTISTEFFMFLFIEAHREDDFSTISSSFLHFISFFWESKPETWGTLRRACSRFAGAYFRFGTMSLMSVH